MPRQLQRAIATGSFEITEIFDQSAGSSRRVTGLSCITCAAPARNGSSGTDRCTERERSPLPRRWPTAGGRSRPGAVVTASRLLRQGYAPAGTTRRTTSTLVPQADPGGVATPRFWHRLIRFRHVISGSLALASLNHTCRNLVPTFPQRSPPSLLTTAACGGLRSTPDCRPRRALLHLSYSYAPPCGPALLVTQCHKRTSVIAYLLARYCFAATRSGRGPSAFPASAMSFW
jgi:hypothetical protein